jgi:hypothetical protein
MTVADLHHEAARRYVDTLPIAEWANALLVFLRVPLATRQPAHVADLAAILRRVTEDQAVEHFTPAELAALTRFCASPAGRSIARKSAAFTAAVTRAQTAEVAAWARTVGAPIEPQASAGEATS